MSEKRMNGFFIMLNLMKILGKLSFLIVFAIINGSLGFLSAIGVVVFGVLGLCKLMGENISLSYNLIFILILSSGFLRGILRYIEQYLNHYIAFKLLATLRNKIFAKLITLAPSKLETKKKGKIISMITSDIETLEVFYAHTLSPIGIAVVTSGVILFVLGYFISWELMLLLLGFYLILGVLYPVYASSLLKVPGTNYRKRFTSFNGFFLDSIRGIKDIIYYNNVKTRLEEVDKRSQSLLCETKKIKQKTFRIFAGTDFLIGIGIILSLVLGSFLNLKGILSVPMMILGVSLILSSFGPVTALSALPSSLNQTFASGDRVIKLLKEAPLVPEIKNESHFKFENLKVNNLDFKYEKEMVIKNLSLKLNRGEIIGIKGPSGCGKSTLLKLLLRSFISDDQKIKYNDLPLNKINTSSLYKNITLVSQDTYLFKDTIFNNLILANPKANKDAVITACKKASIHDFIMSLDKGYDSEISALSRNISAGEAQRLSLARAFLKDSPVLFLDEPTSNVDSINEGIILKSILENKSDKAIILVSHRESTMKIADIVYNFNDGGLVRE